MIEIKYFAGISYKKINAYLQLNDWEKQDYDLDPLVNVYTNNKFPKYAICIPKDDRTNRIVRDYSLLYISLTEFGKFYGKTIYELLNEIREVDNDENVSNVE